MNQSLLNYYERESKTINTFAQSTLSSYISWLIFFLGIELTAIALVMSSSDLQPVNGEFHINPNGVRVIAMMFSIQTILASIATIRVGIYYKSCLINLKKIDTEIAKLLYIKNANKIEGAIAISMYTKVFPIILVAISVYLLFWVPLIINPKINEVFYIFPLKSL